MKYIVAVSGGVDSVVLLDMMAASDADIIVAHFDHGIREESAEDAAFVAALARHYEVPFEVRREELGEQASEAFARERRYLFLRELAEKYDARIMTAHHLDDLVETVAINATRGTGWRGLAVFQGQVVRPLIAHEKEELIEYANQKGLQWREDSTNASEAYLRNRIRKKSHHLSEDEKRQLHALHTQQKSLRNEIEAAAKSLVGSGPKYSRYLFITLPTKVALECLWGVTRGALTRPQLARLLHAIKTARPNTTYQAKSGLNIRFSTRYFTL